MMRILYSLFATFFVITVAHAADRKNDAVSFDLSSVRVSEVVQLIYRDVLSSAYLLDPEVLADARLVSFRYALKDRSRAGVLPLLDAIGLEVVQRAGIDYVRPRQAVNDVYVYRPKYRDVTYLVELLRSIFKGSFTSTRSLALPTPVKSESTVPAPAGSAAALVDRDADLLVFNGPAAEIRQLEGLLPKVDARQGDVLVRGVVYEVSASDKAGSAFSLALSLLGGHVSAALNGGSALANSVRLQNVSLDAVFSVLSADSRFKVVSSPSLRVRSGGAGRISVGQDVPVLGAVTYPGNGSSPVQSIEYRSSGVIFDLRPVVREQAVELDIGQQVSSFVATETGVNGSPTLIKREVKSSLSLADGEIVLLGGLAEQKHSEGASGLSFLPSVFRSKTMESSNTEILLVLQLTRL